jgi:LacI family transcriptional regulator
MRRPGDPTFPDKVAKTATMRDVAAVAGVSLKTVSRVVNDEEGVSPEFVSRVKEAVDLLGFQPNLSARSLRRTDQKTSTIGVLLEDVSNPFSSALHRAIEDVASARGSLVFAGSSDEDPGRAAEVLRAFMARRVDGLIVVPAGDDLSVVTEDRVGRPVVLADRRAVLESADSVTVDNRGGVAGAIAHLAQGGHDRIAFLGDLTSIWTANERYMGFVEGMSAQGRRLDPALVRRGLRGVQAAEDAVGEFLAEDDPPTAIFAAQNLLTVGTLRALQHAGLQQSVALIGFDDIKFADMVDPPMTLVTQDVTGVGRTAAELLFARLDGDVSPPKHVVLPTRLVTRGSGEIAAPGVRAL